MKASRLLSLLMLLQSRGRSTAPELAQALEVSTRTILRDIDQLSAAGVPVWGERGRQGGFQLRPGWSTQLTGLTEPEASALLLAGLPGPATELGLGDAAVSARLKLLASVPLPLRTGAADVAQRLHIDPHDWYRAPDAAPWLREAAEAVWRGRRVVVDYTSWQRRAQRELDPLGLVLKAGSWYLVALAPGQTEPRTYRLASIGRMQLLTQAVRRPRGFDLAAYWQASAARFEAQLRPLVAQVLASPRALAWLVQARRPHTLQAGPPAGVRLPRGWRCIELPIESIDHGARQVLGHGAQLQVLGPPALRRAVARLARQLLAQHDTVAR
ncbi:YafY family protein [uncultured Aquincola sp.]|uniref:helix-turn-helix transcriptional regulator n=1 Tax=uncultured Aquincola sp. TaxID=886556 RepID=UPI0032B187B5